MTINRPFLGLHQPHMRRQRLVKTLQQEIQSLQRWILCCWSYQGTMLMIMISLPGSKSSLRHDMTLPCCELIIITIVIMPAATYEGLYLWQHKCVFNLCVLRLVCMGQILDTDESMGLSSSEFRIGMKKLVSKTSACKRWRVMGGCDALWLLK